MAAFDLVTTAQAQASLPLLTPSEQADLPSVITSVSAAFENFCRRKLALWNFDRLHRPGRVRRIQLASWPVLPGTRVKTDLVVALNVMNVSASNQFAYISANPVSTTSLQIASIVLTTNAAGVATNTTLTFANYNTVNDLAAAINALGNGWLATPQSVFGPYALTECTCNYGASGALNQFWELQLYQRDVARFALTPRRGTLELTENRPEAFRYPDRAYGIGYGWSWSAAAEPRHADVRVIYRAGYAVQPADIAAGFDPVPADLQRAMILSLRATLDATKSPDRKSEADGAMTYDKGEYGPCVIPMAAQRILLNSEYTSYRLR